MSNQEVEELKTLIKALKIRLKNEEISQEEYDQLMLKYETQLEEETSLLRERSFLKKLSYIAISGSGKVTDSYISISGSGKIEGWKGGSIAISGSGKITEEEIDVSGSASLPSDLKTSVLKASGSLKVDGPLTVYEDLSLSGSTKIDGNLNAEDASIKMSGALKVDGDIVCREAELKGGYDINGDIICRETFTSELSYKSTIRGDLTCNGDINIEQDSHNGKLKINKIVSNGHVYLEGVHAEYVSGLTVKIGRNCEIETIEEKK